MSPIRTRLALLLPPLAHLALGLVACVQAFSDGHMDTGGAIAFFFFAIILLGTAALTAALGLLWTTPRPVARRLGRGAYLLVLLALTIQSWFVLGIVFTGNPNTCFYAAGIVTAPIVYLLARLW